MQIIAKIFKTINNLLIESGGACTIHGSDLPNNNVERVHRIQTLLRKTPIIRLTSPVGQIETPLPKVHILQLQLNNRGEER